MCNVHARCVLAVHTEWELIAHWQQASAQKQPVLVVGSGSNVLSLENFAGTVLLDLIYGIAITDCIDSWILHVGAGGNLAQFSEFLSGSSNART